MSTTSTSARTSSTRPSIAASRSFLQFSSSNEWYQRHRESHHHRVLLDASLAVDPHVGAAMSLPTHDARIRSTKDGWRNTPIQKYFPSQTDATATVLPKSSGGSSKGSGASCFAPAFAPGLNLWCLSPAVIGALVIVDSRLDPKRSGLKAMLATTEQPPPHPRPGPATQRVAASLYCLRRAGRALARCGRW